jgi:hypothetical protein
MDFGLQGEEFGQHESLTRRLRGILDLYPEGPSILSELIQNADDAGARTVKVMYNAKVCCAALFRIMHYFVSCMHSVSFDAFAH